MDKVEKSPAQLMEIALRMQGISVSVGVIEQIIETYTIFRRKRGKFSLSDAAQIQYKHQQNYPQRQPENESQETPQQGTIPQTPAVGDLFSVKIKTTACVDENLAIRCDTLCQLYHTEACVKMNCVKELREDGLNVYFRLDKSSIQVEETKQE